MGAQMWALPFNLVDRSLFSEASYIHGKATTARSGRRFQVIDPGSGEGWAECTDCAAEDVDAAIESSHRAFQEFSRTTPKKRAQLLMRWYEACVAARDDLAQIVTFETGKPLAEAYGELDYAFSFLWWFSGEAERVQGSIAVPSAPSRRTMVIKQPVGVAVALVPWNFPVAMVLRKAGAALAAGCTMTVKPSPETPVSCLALARLATRAGFPDGVLNVLTTSLENTPSLSEALCTHPKVKKVSFTGSTRVGKIVAGLCARNLIKCTLELGGNCPFIVFDDADLERAAEQFMALKWRHAGQACITANRLYVQAGVHDAFVQTIVDRTRQLKLGHGASKDTTLGPLTTPRSIAKAEEQVNDALERGARLVLGGGHASDASHPKGGYFMEPKILVDMTAETLMAHQETFAPVCGVFRFDTEAEVIELANRTSMGLASYAFTTNVNRVWRLMDKLEAGMIGLNTGNASAAETPFGGIKESGLGKESGKDVAINEYLITKTCTLTVADHY